MPSTMPRAPHHPTPASQTYPSTSPPIYTPYRKPNPTPTPDSRAGGRNGRAPLAPAVSADSPPRRRNGPASLADGHPRRRNRPALPPNSTSRRRSTQTDHPRPGHKQIPQDQPTKATAKEVRKQVRKQRNKKIRTKFKKLRKKCCGVCGEYVGGELGGWTWSRLRLMVEVQGEVEYVEEEEDGLMFNVVDVYVEEVCRSMPEELIRDDGYGG
ncbi:hypothetical protein BJ508DRAFT_379949 [Ascobolus immersus RN42]|uniref:Uncharacterized protein n=1 Tax=Ascobolus immersus RN42 TaxID=1160509 RepID=A0A3N4HUG9_ASCIM|nr:hypothetical protein BJ508DRAFT_379949 [Ascobolus immersus RN42]